MIHGFWFFLPWTLKLVSCNVIPRSLINDYQCFGQNCCFPLGDMTTGIVISFWTSGSVLHKHKCSVVYMFMPLVLGSYCARNKPPCWHSKVSRWNSHLTAVITIRIVQRDITNPLLSSSLWMVRNQSIFIPFDALECTSIQGRRALYILQWLL